MALEGEGSQKSSSDRAGGKGKGKGKGNEDAHANADKQGGLSDTIKELFAGRLMNYIEVTLR